ncbi:MAG: sulfatase [Blastochloris sp.]|nr:sulfatase [Blastochloris sp.]
MNSTQPGSTASRPNIVWIFGDQHRAQSLGYAGDPNLSTPHLDRAAREGLYLPAAVSGCPLCCPFRGSLLTGLYPHQAVPGHEDRMPEALPTVGSLMRAGGYDTYYLGKWHLDGFHEREGRAAWHRVPPERRGGFERWEGYENNNAQYDSWIHGGEGDQAFHEKLPGYETDVLTDRFLAYLKARAEERQGGGEGVRPFFAVLSVQPPHDPYVAPEAWSRRHRPGQMQFRPNVPAVPRIRERASRDLAGYHAMIENLDDNFGRIRELLLETGLAENTHIIFFSDHGDMHGSQGQFLKTGPYEEAVRVPFIHVLGRGAYNGTVRGVRDWLINHVDYLPTTLGLAGLPVPEHLPGFDYSPHLLNRADAAPVPDSAYLQLVRPTGHAYSVDRPWRGVVTRDGWKYVCLEGQPLLMFNLKEDPYELCNLAYNTAFSAERSRLQGMLAEWIGKTGDEFVLPKGI